jgi:hypothetical protein
MARLTGPDDQYRMFVLTTGAKRGQAFAPPGTPVPLYSDDQASIGADVRAMDGSVISGDPVPTVLIGDTYQAPLFKYPDGVDVVYTRILGGPIVPLYARESDRFAEFQTAVTTAQTAATAAQSAATSAASNVATAQAAATTAATAATTAAGNVGAAQTAATNAATSASQAAASAAQAAVVGPGAGAALAIVFGA